MQKGLTKIEQSCSKVKTAVLMIEKNRAKYSHIDDKELANRKETVAMLEKVRYSNPRFGTLLVDSFWAYLARGLDSRGAT